MLTSPRNLLAVLVCLAVVLPVTVANAASTEQPAAAPTDTGLGAYSVEVQPKVADDLRRDGYDITRLERLQGGEVELEVIMSPDEADELRKEGLDVTENPADDGVSARQAGGPVFRPWSGPGNLEQELRQLAEDYPRITDLRTIGTSVQGQEILALQVTRNAGRGHIGRKPTVLYQSAQHAREWISPEVNRRLLRHYLDNYGSDREITRLVNRNELWFVLVANPDGYDYTFEAPENRLWRKNLSDNDGDGQITTVDGTDLNRNWPYKWGYDNEGSSDQPSSQVYRGTSPASEPEINSIDAFIGELEPEFFVDWHSAAELLLYGVGWQVATPTPDDVLHETITGDDETPAIAGFDPDVSAELYTTNGASTDHVTTQHGALSYTPELSECQSVAPDPTTCQSVFNFPDDETLIQEEFERALPFALDLARSARRPYEPDSHLGNTAPDFVLDEFDVSHSGRQEVAATVSRQVRRPILFYRINDRRIGLAFTHEWDGGERYGGDFDRYYREVRASIRGARPGDEVEWWLLGWSPGTGLTRSERSSYTVATEAADVLVLANEDYTGVAPEQPGVASPQYAADYVEAVEASGRTADVWDIDASGAPHDLGVLSHYDAVVWYTGDNRITSDPEDLGILGLPDLGVDEVMQYATVAVRDYLNEGGKLVQTGEYAGYFGPLVSQTGGLFYGDNGAPEEPCSVEGSIFDDCLVLSDDFHQYWLGAWQRQPFGAPDRVEGVAAPLDGLAVDVGGGDGADNQDAAGSVVVTSDVLPPGEFPQFTSTTSAVYAAAGPGPFDPPSGDYYVGVPATNLAWNRLTRTIDLTAVDAADTPALAFATSYDVEAGYDFFGVEARTDGGDDWTMLPDSNGNTVQGPLSVCSDGLWDVHPFVFEHYVDEATCAPSGPTGEFHAFNGNSGGYVDVSFDLSAYAGSTVEVSLAYISDVGVTATGAFVDDVALEVGGAAVEEEGFEGGLGAWAPTPPPDGSPASITEWQRSTGLVPDAAAGVSTEDTVYLPFGFEAIATESERNGTMAALLDGLIE